MRQIGVIRQTAGKSALVAVRRMSACEGCHKANPGMGSGGEVGYASCHECSIFPVDTDMTVTAVNEIGADVGDRVLLESSSQMILGYAAAVFLLPIFLAAVLGVLFAALLPYVWSAYLGAVIGFAGAFLLVKICVDRHAKEKTVYTVIGKLSANGGNQTADEYRERAEENMEH
ncbi:MAG: SoxR reducing system RseC family protein [Eubacteriales bacterium]